MRTDDSACNPLRSRIMAAWCGVVCILGAAASLAQTIDNFPPEEFLSALGEPFAPYYAQTFVALPGVATDLAIEVAEQSGPDDLEFHVLITEVTGYGPAFRPTVVLFESSTIAFRGPVPAIIHVPIPNLTLVPGTRYAFVLDAFVTRDGVAGQARVGTNGSYPNGEFYFNQALVGNSRAEHFAAPWFFAESIYPTRYYDLAFQLNFAPATRDIPATSGLGLIAVSVLIVGAALAHIGRRSSRG